ncbi:MAG: hypothetical protein M3Z26_18285, partial [Bacteroidota bacterium]|nr:hypothetical protein [Bacteroidota bacterium]
MITQVALPPLMTNLLQRAQTSVGLVQEVVRESSAEYWFGLGMDKLDDNQWLEAIYAFERCIELDITDLSPHFEIID